MARVCQVCGKGRSLGNQIETRGKAKYLGGVGTKITGISRRAFLPNLQNVRTTTANGTPKTVRVCAQCIRSGAVSKQVRNAPFRVTQELETMPLGSSHSSKQKVGPKTVKTVAKQKTPPVAKKQQEKKAGK